jgi:hypothetical protein
MKTALLYKTGGWLEWGRFYSTVAAIAFFALRQDYSYRLKRGDKNQFQFLNPPDNTTSKSSHSSQFINLRDSILSPRIYNFSWYTGSAS